MSTTLVTISITPETTQTKDRGNEKPKTTQRHFSKWKWDTWKDRVSQVSGSGIHKITQSHPNEWVWDTWNDIVTLLHLAAVQQLWQHKAIRVSGSEIPENNTWPVRWEAVEYHGCHEATSVSRSETTETLWTYSSEWPCNTVEDVGPLITSSGTPESMQSYPSEWQYNTCDKAESPQWAQLCTWHNMKPH